jgi:hypothetical protein
LPKRKSNRDEIRSSDLFEPERLCGTGDGANAAAHAFSWVDCSQIVFHRNGVEEATVQAGLTTRTQIWIHDGLETAGGCPFFRARYTGPVQTTVLAAITDDMAHNLAIINDMNKPFLLGHLDYFNGFTFGQSSPCASLEVVFGRAIHLYADFQRFPA